MRMASPSWREPIMPTAKRKVSGSGHHATSAIEPRIKSPRMCDQGDALPGRTPAHGDQLILGQEIAGTHAKRGHDDSLPPGEFETDGSGSPTRRSRALSPASFVVACSPSTRSISVHNSSARTAHRIALDHHADCDRPEPPRSRVRIAQRTPAVALDLAGIGAQPLAAQPLDGALHQRREILAAARQSLAPRQRRPPNWWPSRSRPARAYIPAASAHSAPPVLPRAPHTTCRGRRLRRTRLPWCGSNR